MAAGCRDGEVRIRGRVEEFTGADVSGWFCDGCAGADKGVGDVLAPGACIRERDDGEGEARCIEVRSHVMNCFGYAVRLREGVCRRWSNKVVACPSAVAKGVVVCTPAAGKWVAAECWDLEGLWEERV